MIKDLKPREIQTLERIENTQKSSIILKCFFEKGFKSFIALFTIVRFYYPKIDNRQLLDFWHFRVYDEKVAKILENVLEQLKSE